MDPKFQSSFIPKASMPGNPAPKADRSLFGFISGLIFVASIFALGGVYGYKKIVENSIQNIKSEIAAEESRIDKPGIQDLLDFDKKTRAIKELLDSHVAVTGFFSMLEKDTTSGVQYLNLKYNASNHKSITFELSGKALSYAAIAQQESILLANPNAASINFSNLILDKKSSKVGFVVKGEFKEDLVKYKNLLPKEATTTEEIGIEETDLNIDDLTNIDDIEQGI